MKTFKQVMCVVLLCSACVKVGVHTWRHFHPPAVTTTAP